jgi:hypothetical protein
MFHVVIQEVPLPPDVFGFLANQCVLGVSDSALIVFPYDGVPVMEVLKIPPMSWRRCSPSFVATVGE